MKKAILALLALVFAADAPAGGFRCGTRLVVVGDPVSRLVRHCGQPAHKFKAKETIGRRGGGQATAVTNWVYDRGRKRDMVVSVRGGRVVKIEVG